MRLFIAVEIDAETRAQLAAARVALAGVLDQAPITPRVTWVAPELAHVTVRFVGERTDEELGRIQTALGDLSFEPFDMRWGRVGMFGGLRNPRVIWAAPTAGAEAMGAVAAAINHRLVPVCGPAETRVFKPHLTFGRVRDRGRGMDWRRALAAVELSPTVTHVTHVTLFQSRLSPKGPAYTALSRHG